LVIDPVMVATSGARLLRPDAVSALCEELFPWATLLTPNVPEAEILCGRRLQTVDDLRAAARDLNRRWGCAVLLKGGHLRNQREAVDVFHGAAEDFLLRAPFIRGVATHGTGCTYSAAITALLARGVPLAAATRAAKAYLSSAIAGAVLAGRHTVLPCRRNWRGIATAATDD
jgi:hydroxymethylpyrimidine/phosphomethylpyrimidine kinase